MRKVTSALIGMLLAAACLPKDESTERGAINVHLAASGIDVEVGSVYKVTFEQLTMVARGDLLDCHAVYYVQRPLSAIAIIDLTKPYTFEHRSLIEERCNVLVGFVPAPAMPHVAAGVTDAEAALIQGDVDGGAIVGTVHARARVSYEQQSTGTHVERVVDVRIMYATGWRARFAVAPRGGKTDAAFSYDTRPLAEALLSASFSGGARKTLVTNEDLTPGALETLRQAASERWMDGALDGGVIEPISDLGH